MTEEQLKSALISPQEIELYKIIQSVCPNAFLTNRQRLALIYKLADLLDKEIDKAVSK